MAETEVLAEVIQRTREYARWLFAAPDTIHYIRDQDPWPSVAEIRKLLDYHEKQFHFMELVSYISRNWTPSHAQQLFSQVANVTRGIDVVIAEFQHIERTQLPRSNAVFNRRRAAEFAVVCKLTGQELDRWATEIEQRQCLLNNGLGRGSRRESSIRKPWQPPPGYVGRKTICLHPRFQKHGKNPVPSTIDVWVKSAERKGEPITVVQAPDTGENHYPEAWIHEQVHLWNPRKSKRNHST